MTPCLQNYAPQTVHRAAGLLRVVAQRFAHRSLRGRSRRVGAPAAAPIDTIGGRGDALFRLNPIGAAADRRAPWTWRGWNAKAVGPTQ